MRAMGSSSKKGRAPSSLTADQRKEIVGLAVAAGIKAYRDEATKHRKEIYDRRLYNTKLLMKNYRDLKEHADKAVFDASTAEDEDVYEILNLMSEWVREEASTVDSIKKSAARTKLIMDHINEMLQIYRAACERSKRPEDIRRYNVLYDYYIGPEDLSLEEIAEKYSVDARTVYRDIRDATARITALLFGVDGIFK